MREIFALGARTTPPNDPFYVISAPLVKKSGGKKSLIFFFQKAFQKRVKKKHFLPYVYGFLHGFQVLDQLCISSFRPIMYFKFYMRKVG